MRPKRPKYMDVSYSPSQVKNYMLCNMRWAFSTLARIKDETTARQGDGIRGHSYLERLLEGGALTDEELSDNIGRRAQAAYEKNLKDLVPYIYEIEMTLDNPFKIGDKQRWAWSFADLVLVNGKVSGRAFDLAIIDNKFRGSFDWALAEEQLPNDLQLMFYAYFAAEKMGWTAEKILVGHHDILTKGRLDSRLVTTVVTKQHVQQRFNKMLPVLQQMERDRAHGDLLRVLPTGKDNGGCEAFGGCPWAAPCRALLEHRVAADDTKRLRELMSRKEEIIPTAPAGTLDAKTVQGLAAAVLAPQEEEEETEMKTLYVNCAPIAGTAMSIERVMASTAEHICASQKVEDWRDIPYGKGKGMLLAALRKGQIELPLRVSIGRNSDLHFLREFLDTWADEIVVGY